MGQRKLCLQERSNEKDDNVDVCIEPENGQQYVLVIATPDNLKSLIFTIFKTGALLELCKALFAYSDVAKAYFVG